MPNQESMTPDRAVSAPAMCCRERLRLAQRAAVPPAAAGRAAVRGRNSFESRSRGPALGVGAGSAKLDQPEALCTGLPALRKELATRLLKEHRQIVTQRFEARPRGDEAVDA